MKRFKKLLFISLFMLGVGTAFTQVTTSGIKGIVLDDNAVPFSRANIIAVHTPSGTKLGGITNFDGRYNLLNMRVGGPYTVTISYIGYKTQTFDDVYLELGKAYI